jgi:hypothetical protein
MTDKGMIDAERRIRVLAVLVAMPEAGEVCRPDNYIRIE